MISKRVRAMLAGRKGLSDPDALEGWGGAELIALACLLLRRWVRGAMLRFRLGRCEGLPLCERHVRIYHARHVKAGRALNLEEGCEIVGLSRRGIVFGERCTVGRFASIRPTNVLFDEPGEGLALGSHSNIGAYCYIGCSGYIEIGDNVLMGPRVSLLAENHHFERTDIPIREQGVVRRGIRIEDDCWLGAGCTILDGVTIGEGSVVAAGSVVTKDVAPGSIVGGVPASLIRTRE